MFKTQTSHQTRPQTQRIEAMAQAKQMQKKEIDIESLCNAFKVNSYAHSKYIFHRRIEWFKIVATRHSSDYFSLFVRSSFQIISVQLQLLRLNFDSDCCTNWPILNGTFFFIFCASTSNVAENGKQSEMY